MFDTTVDGTSQFNFWNLNANTEEPFVSTSVGSGEALNKLVWVFGTKRVKGGNRFQ